MVEKRMIVETEGGKYGRYQLRDFGGKVYVDKLVGYRSEPVGTAKSVEDAIELVKADSGKKITAIDGK